MLVKGYRQYAFSQGPPKKLCYDAKVLYYKNNDLEIIDFTFIWKDKTIHLIQTMPYTNYKQNKESYNMVISTWMLEQSTKVTSILCCPNS